MESKSIIDAIKSNGLYALGFVLIVAAIFAAAYVFEMIARRRSGTVEKIFTTRNVAMIGIFSAFALVLHLLDFPLPFAPSFYKLDFSEIPVLIGSYALGPVAGVMIEVVKIMLKLVIKGTSTAFIGDLANFVIGCSFILPASIMYRFRRTRGMAILSCVAGTLTITALGTAFNAFYLLPAFSKFYGMPMDTLIGMGTSINPKITSITSFVILAVAPLNLIKGAAVSIVTLLLYKPLMKALRKMKMIPPERDNKNLV